MAIFAGELKRIGDQLERIADLLETSRGVVKASLPTQPDEKYFSYTEDVEEYKRELERAQYEKDAKRPLAPWEDPPSHEWRNEDH